MLVLCTPGRRELGERVAEILGSRAVGVFAGARTHVPVATAAAGLAEAERHSADGCVSVGGGSAIGLGKAIALRTRMPTVCVPTTCSAPAARAALSRAWRTSDPAAWLSSVVRELGAPTSLRALGLSEDAIEPVTRAALARPYANPRPVTHDLVVTVLHAAWSGEAPVLSA